MTAPNPTISDLRTQPLFWVLDADHNAVPCNDVLEWAEMFEVRDQRRVAWDKVGDFTISTVFLGINHQYFDGPPLVFETMVFEGDSRDELECYRYSTWAEAMAGHAAIKAKLEVEGLRD